MVIERASSCRCFERKSEPAARLFFHDVSVCVCHGLSRYVDKIESHFKVGVRVYRTYKARTPRESQRAVFHLYSARQISSVVGVGTSIEGVAVVFVFIERFGKFDRRGGIDIVVRLNLNRRYRRFAHSRLTYANAPRNGMVRIANRRVVAQHVRRGNPRGSDCNGHIPVRNQRRVKRETAAEIKRRIFGGSNYIRLCPAFFVEFANADFEPFVIVDEIHLARPFFSEFACDFIHSVRNRKAVVFTARNLGNRQRERRGINFVYSVGGTILEIKSCGNPCVFAAIAVENNGVVLGFYVAGNSPFSFVELTGNGSFIRNVNVRFTCVRNGYGRKGAQRERNARRRDFL